MRAAHAEDRAAHPPQPFQCQRHTDHEEQEHDKESWISPEEASILGYGFAYEEALDETRRRMQLWEEEQEQRKRDDDSMK